MNHTITITLTAAAQRAALLASEPAAREQTYEVSAELLQRLLALPWAVVDAAGVATCHVPTRLEHPDWVRYDCPCDARPADAAAAIAHAEAVHAGFDEHRAERRAARATEQAAEQARRAVDLAAARAWAVQSLAERVATYAAREHHWGHYPDVIAAVREAGAEIARLDAAKVTTRLTHLAALAAEHGDETAQERIAAGPGPLGLLPETEALVIVRDARLPVDEARGLVEYALMTGSDLPPAVTGDADLDVERASAQCGGASYRAYPVDADEVGGLGAAEWREVMAIRAALAEAGLPADGARCHVSECTTNDCPRHGAKPATGRRIGVRVTLDLGNDIKVAREYGACAAARS